MILCDDYESYKWFKKACYDGRDLGKNYLDDDIEIYPTYFKELLQRFAENQDFVGISGLAENQIIKDRKRYTRSDDFMR